MFGPRNGAETVMGVCVLGGVNLDHVARVERLPLPGETVASLGLEQFPGGKGANQAIASARQGAATRLLGAVGEDDAGRFMLGCLSDAGVDGTGVLRRADTPTGQAFISLDAKGRNSIVVAAGANASFGPAEAEAADLSGCTVVLTQFEATLPAIEVLLTRAAGAALRVLNAAPALDAGRALLELADILVVNETELARFAGLDAPPADAEAAVAGAARLARPGQTVVATLGAEGLIAVTDGQSLRVPGRPADVVDTTGAGDCFCGALAARLSMGEPLERALAYANAAAAISVGRAGAATSSPTASEVEALLRAA